MKKYMISYDLLKPGQNYEALWERLRELGARKILYSQWVLRTASMTALQIRDDLTRFVDANDRLLVTGLNLRRVLRLISRTAFSTAVLSSCFCLIFVPFSLYDEPKTSP